MNMDNQKKKIAIVDDEPSFLDIFSKAFEGIGCEVKTFLGPKEAIDNIPSYGPDLILLDISMPEFDGFQVFEHLKKSFKENMPKVIFLTSFGESIAGAEVDSHFAQTIGAQGHIKKSEDLNVIVDKVKKELAK